MRPFALLGEGARVLWTTQGATKVYRSLGEPVTSEMDIRLGPGAGIEMVPDPIVPYKDSIYRQMTKVDLARGARVLYGESVYHGRVASGEWFDYASLEMRLSVHMEGTPLLSDALVVRPQDGSPERLGLFEPHPYLGSFYVLGGDDGELRRAHEEADAFLAEGRELIGGASRLDGPGVLVRWLAASPERMRRAYFEIWGVARRALFGTDAPRLRKF